MTKFGVPEIRTKVVRVKPSDLKIAGPGDPCPSFAWPKLDPPEEYVRPCKLMFGHDGPHEFDPPYTGTPREAA